MKEEQVIFSNIRGYHSNTEQKCKDFIEKNILIKSDDQLFLGKGMYFWDNSTNAMEWKETKKRQYPNDNILTVMARINIDNILDLTDKKVIDTINELWGKYIKKLRGNDIGKFYCSDEKVKLGVVLDSLPIINQLPVRRIALNYRTDYNPFYKFSNLKVCNFSSSMKMVYMVKDKNCITDESYYE